MNETVLAGLLGFAGGAIASGIVGYIYISYKLRMMEDDYEVALAAHRMNPDFRNKPFHIGVDLGGIETDTETTIDVPDHIFTPYSSYSKPVPYSAKMAEFEDGVSDIEPNAGEEEAPDDEGYDEEDPNAYVDLYGANRSAESPPYVISEEVYNTSCLDYGKVELTLYSDGVLHGDDGIQSVSELLGSPPDIYPYGNKKVTFIRNHKLETDFEVERVGKPYISAPDEDEED